MSTPLPTCGLCKLKPANKTNSHIFSWFLIRDAVNKAGVKDRENEVVFSLDGENVKTYIGRGQSTEDKVIPIKGRPLRDEEIQETENENPFSRDNIICSDCEHKLDVLEGEVNNRIIAGLRKIGVPEGLSFQRETIVRGDLLRLFIYSLTWRAALVKINTFEMLPQHQEHLRAILNTCVDDEVSILEQKIAANSTIIRGIPAIINFMEVKGQNNNPINCSISYRPYSMQLNDLGFQLFFEDAPVGDDDPLFQEINRVIQQKDFVIQNEHVLALALISDEVRRQINTNLYTRMGKESLRKATLKFIKGYIYIFRVMPSDFVTSTFQHNLSKRSNNKIENFTDHDQYESAQETMYQLYPNLFK